jgi:hypothetical protein
MTKQNQCKGCGEIYVNLKRYGTVYCSHDCYKVNGLKGEFNPFYGKKHSEETLNKLRGDERLSHKGKDNPFYGKTHDEETKELIREKNRVWRENNKELRIQRRLNRKGLTKELLEQHWETYKTSPVNRHYFRDVVGVDYRTFQKFLIDCELQTKEQIAEITEMKQLFQHGSAISAPEMELYGLLVEQFGKDNVEHQSKRFGYWYDFCLFGKVIVEYDGYYYHKILKNKNDKIKEDLALTNGFEFVRIEEDEHRLVDWDAAIKSVKAAVKTATP